MGSYSWLLIVVISGILLGFWDIVNKKATENNSVLNVLAVYSAVMLLLVGFEIKNALSLNIFNILFIFTKTLIVYVMWILSFISIKNLPVSIITPFNSLSPLFTIILGVLILNEKLGLLQAIGITVLLISYYLIGRVGSMEITDFFKNKYLYYMIISNLLGGICAVIDKIVLKSVNIGQMQFWFSFFITLLFGITALIYNKKNRASDEHQPFKFNWYLPLMSLFLVISDRFYFYAVNIQDSQVSIIMPLRRISIFVSVIIGGLLFKEKNLRAKLGCIAVLVAGIVLVFIG